MKKLITTLLFGVIPQLTFAAALQEFNIDNFHSAVEGGDLAMVQEMLEYTGADVNVADWFGRTPLMYTAYHIGNSDAVEALLTAGAQGRNEAAQAARGRGRNEIAKLIENWIIPIKSASKVAVEFQ